MLTLKEKITKNYINARGWKTNQKYLIIESDDWGAIRMPSREVYEEFIKNKIPVDQFSFDKNDSIESEDDLNALFNVLEKFIDNNGNPAVLTAYHVVANPNFEKIEATGRKEYHYESIVETYNRFPHTKQVPNLIKEGIRKGIYIPQFHGREHIHVKRWMEAINSSSEKEQLAFQNKAIISSKSETCNNPYMEDYFKGFAFSSVSENQDLENIHRDGLKIFKELFDFNSLTFVAQGTVFGDHILKMLSEEGVQLILGQQSEPKSDGTYKIINKIWGATNNFNQYYWRRNCRFEPARNQNFPWVSNCMSEIEIAFRWGKPAVISAHRENFVGSIFEENRIQSLEKLEILLQQVMKKWPDVQFISSAKLAEIMLNSKK